MFSRRQRILGVGVVFLLVPAIAAYILGRFPSLVGGILPLGLALVSIPITLLGLGLIIWAALWMKSLPPKTDVGGPTRSSSSLPPS
jgi:hypothetical protein